MISRHPAARFALVVLVATALITGTGAFLGALLWTAAWALSDGDQSWTARAAAGARDLGFYFFIWAPGIGIVLATMREWHRRHARS